MDEKKLRKLFEQLGIRDENPGAGTGSLKTASDPKGDILACVSPIDGKPLAKVIRATRKDYEQVVEKAGAAYKDFQMLPAPKRGEIVRDMAQRLREKKQALGTLISLETGKILSEGLGEVQEMIDIADFAVGLSRQLYGRTMHSERPQHRMYEQWHPLGIVGIITAFNFPAAVWSWNALISAVCGNANLFKPSSKAPLTAIAIQNIIAPVVDQYGIDGIFSYVVGSREDVGNLMLKDTRIPLISATGSTAMGRKVAVETASRFGRSLLELGGNNAIIIAEDADLDMAIRATLFGAVGTAGQRCTSTRRIIIHESIRDDFVQRLVNAYEQIRSGNPLDESTLMGPLIDEKAVFNMQAALEQVQAQGGRIIYGGRPLTVKGHENGFYVSPAIVEARNHFPIVQEETFAPILYIISCQTMDEAIDLHNAVPQGLSSAIFTSRLQYSEHFLSHAGSDCGIANVNIGTSGAEIGGAFGGEKQTGGGRESGSDAWKIYMRRQTNTINWGRQLPLAQGIIFEMN